MDLPELMTYMKEASSQAGLALAELLEQPVSVEIEPVYTDIKPWQEWVNSTIAPLSAVVSMPFDGSFTGISYLLFPQKTFHSLSVMLGELDPTVLDHQESFQGAVVEIGNVLLNICVGTLVNGLAGKVIYQQPEILTIQEHILNSFKLSNASENNQFLLSSSFSINTGVVTAYIMVNMHNGIE
ncbi:MAG: hypothetical protein CL609_13335 [Anaerolineaceae bacterium]|nr:hypothetical protein [Anaerolineaceae bacterium]